MKVLIQNFSKAKHQFFCLKGLLFQIVIGKTNHLLISTNNRGTGVEPLLETPVPNIGLLGLESLLHFCFQLFANAQPRRQQMTAQVVVSLLPTWETWLEYLAPGLVLGLPWLL